MVLRDSNSCQRKGRPKALAGNKRSGSRLGFGGGTVRDRERQRQGQRRRIFSLRASADRLGRATADSRASNAPETRHENLIATTLRRFATHGGEYNPEFLDATTAGFNDFDPGTVPFDFFARSGDMP